MRKTPGPELSFDQYSPKLILEVPSQDNSIVKQFFPLQPPTLHYKGQFIHGALEQNSL